MSTSLNFILLFLFTFLVIFSPYIVAFVVTWNRRRKINKRFSKLNTILKKLRDVRPVSEKDIVMPQFRKKPIVIEAVQWLNKKIVCPPGPLWFAEAEEQGKIRLCGNLLVITTLEGVMEASPGDWIIRGVKGEIYPCKPDIFAATYEEVV